MLCPFEQDWPKNWPKIGPEQGQGSKKLGGTVRDFFLVLRFLLKLIFGFLARHAVKMLI